jgi:hypothetical protein
MYWFEVRSLPCGVPIKIALFVFTRMAAREELNSFPSKISFWFVGYKGNLPFKIKIIAFHVLLSQVSQACISSSADFQHGVPQQ